MAAISRLRLAMAACLSLLLLGIAVPAAQAEFGLSEFDGLITANEGGDPQLQAGGHPFAYTTTIKLATKPGEVDPSVPYPQGPLKDIFVSLPPGLVGNYRVLPTCPEDLLATGEFNGGQCPAETQIGYIELETGFIFRRLKLGVYNQEPSPGSVATFGFNPPVNLGTTHLQAHLRTGSDYGVDIETANIAQQLPIYSIKLSLWGVPADPAHNEDRAKGLFCFEAIGPFSCFVPGGEPSTAPVRPYLTMPTNCEGPTQTTLRASSWLAPDDFVESSYVSHDSGGNPVEPTGCADVPFDPTFAFQPGTRVAGQPTSYSADLHIPYEENPDGVSQSTLRDISVELPQGVTVSSSSVAGLGSCSPAQVDLKGPDAANCPASSKIGSVTISSPLIDHPLPGDLYLATQGTNPFNSLLAMYLSVDDPRTGIAIKLPGKISPDPVTGQLTATFKDNPQLPFEDLHMELKGGARAPLVNPSSCGTYTTYARLSSWARPGEAVPAQSSFTIDQNCGVESKFTPGFSAGTTNPVGGSFSPFTLRVTRPDGQQNVSTIQATLPEGVLAKLAGVPLCGDADAATGDCPASSQVGSVTVGAGAGTNPLYVPQPGKSPTAVYLAGPYKGAPYSLVAKVPAQAGPFDLGTVAVRNAIAVDPTTAQVSVKSDPLPQILQGIPISYRDIRVEVNRDQFTLNPTSCDPMEVKGTIGSAQGTNASVSDRFQVASCERLRFKPHLKLSLKGPTHRNAHPRLKAVLTMPKGANIQKAQVTLPKTELLENAHIRTICTRVQYAAGNGGGEACPKASIYGKARAWSPLLDKPLEGPVYLRSSNHQLPDLVASLDGQIHIDLVGRIDAVHARIRNTFEGVPDAPVSRFVLEMQGGKKGLLANNTELCRTTPRAAVKFDAHSGKLADSNPVMRADCKGKARKQAKKRSAHKRGGKGAKQRR